MCVDARWVGASVAGCSGTWLTFQVRFLGIRAAPPTAAPRQAQGQGQEQEQRSEQVRLRSWRRCLLPSVPCALLALPHSNFPLEFSLMCFIWGVRGGGTRRGNWASGEVEGAEVAGEGSGTFLHPLISRITTLLGSNARMPLAQLPCGSHPLGPRLGGTQRGAQGGWRDREGDIRMRKDPDPLRTTPGWPGGVPERGWKPGARRGSAYFPGGDGG